MTTTSAPGFTPAVCSLTQIAGVTNRIAIDGYGGDFGYLSLNWNMDSLLSIGTMTNGNLQINFSGINGQRYALLVSTDLVTWSTQVVQTMSSGRNNISMPPPARLGLSDGPGSLIGILTFKLFHGWARRVLSRNFGREVFLSPGWEFFTV